MTLTQTPRGTLGLLRLLTPYALVVGALIALTLISSALALAIPKVISRAIDAYPGEASVPSTVVVHFGSIALLLFVATYLQSVVQVYVSGRVAKDLREQFVARLAAHSYIFLEQLSTAHVLTCVTSDIDAIKLFVSQAIASIISSFFLIAGSAVLLFSINWLLAIVTLGLLPVIAISFYVTLSKVRPFIRAGREAVDWLNRVITESLCAAALIRVLVTPDAEYRKFLAAGTASMTIDLTGVRFLCAH